MPIFCRPVLLPAYGDNQTIADAARINALFGSGLEIYRFGSTPEQVNDQLPVHFGNLTWSSMPVSGEYKSDVIRYFWVHISHYQQVKYMWAFAKEIKASFLHIRSKLCCILVQRTKIISYFDKGDSNKGLQ